MREYDHTSATGMLLGGRYQVVARLDAGGMGAVYEGQDTRLGRPVAIKLLHRHIAEDVEYLARFRREALITAGLHHANIVQLLDFALPEDGPPYIVMERLDGESLARHVRTHGPLPVARAVSIGLQVLAAVEVAHAAGVTHRDLKPHNVFLVPLSGDTDLVKVLDFGIASVKSGPGFERLTNTGLVLGTPATMAPEQALGEPADARADLYACGVVLYFVLAGALPFSGPDVGVVLRSVINDPPPPLESVRRDVGAALAEVVRRALRKAPADRWQTATEMASALRAVAAFTATSPKAPSGPLLPTEAGRLRAQPERPASTLAATPDGWPAAGAETAPDTVHATRSSARVVTSVRPEPASASVSSPSTRARNPATVLLALSGLGAIVVAGGMAGGWLAYRTWIAPESQSGAPSAIAPVTPVRTAAIPTPVADTHDAAVGDAGTSDPTHADLTIARPEIPRASAHLRRSDFPPVLLPEPPGAAATDDEAPEESGSVTVEEVFDARAPRDRLRRRARQLAPAVSACAPASGARGTCAFWLDIDPRGQAELATYDRCSGTSLGRAMDCATSALSRGGWPALDATYRIRVRVAWP